MKTNTKLDDIQGWFSEKLKKKALFLESTQPHGIGPEWSLTLSNHHKTHTGSILDDFPIILRPIWAPLMWYALCTTIVSDRHWQWLDEAETAKPLKKLPKAPKTSEILISDRKIIFSKNVRWWF
jgi:hypothetical protein